MGAYGAALLARERCRKRGLLHTLGRRAARDADSSDGARAVNARITAADRQHFGDAAGSSQATAASAGLKRRDAQRSAGYVRLHLPAVIFLPASGKRAAGRHRHTPVLAFTRTIRSGTHSLHSWATVSCCRPGRPAACTRPVSKASLRGRCATPPSWRTRGAYADRQRLKTIFFPCVP